MVYLSDSGGVYGYTAEEEPKVGEVVTLDTSAIRAQIESVAEGEKGRMFTAVRSVMPERDRPGRSTG